MWSDHCFEVDGCSSVDNLEGQHHHLELDACCNRKPNEVANEAHWSIPGLFAGWESSQDRVVLVQAGYDQRLDQELCCILCEERPDPADVVEGKSAGLGHSGDVGGAGEFLADDHVLVPRSWWRRYCYVLDGDWQVHERAVFPWDEEEFSFMKVELEVMRWDACQTLWESHCNMGVGGWVKREEQFGVVCIAVKS